MAAVFMVCRRFEVTDRCIQRIPQVFEWHGGPGLRIVFCKPTAGIRKAAAHAVVDFGVKGTVVAAVGEINFPVDYPARVFEQGKNIACDSTCITRCRIFHDNDLNQYRIFTGRPSVIQFGELLS